MDRLLAVGARPLGVTLNMVATHGRKGVESPLIFSHASRSPP